MKIKKRLITLLVVISLAVGLVACRTIGTSPDSQIDGDSKSSGTLVIEGSTSVQKIFQELADSFMEKNSDVVVEYMGTGSSSGIKAAIADTADIGTASREVKDEEIKKGLKVYQVAEDAIAIIVHPSNNIVALSKEHVAKIYTKEITNWKEVGGNDAPIVVVARDAASGTREAFEAIFDVMVCGNIANIPDSLLSTVSPMTATIAKDMSYAGPFHQSALFGIGVVLFIFILILNLVLNSIVNKAVKD